MWLLQTHENKYYYQMLNSSFSPPILMQETACSSQFRAEGDLGPAHLEWVLLTAATVYRRCSPCVHSTCEGDSQ